MLKKEESNPGVDEDGRDSLVPGLWDLVQPSVPAMLHGATGRLYQEALVQFVEGVGHGLETVAAVDQHGLGALEGLVAGEMPLEHGRVDPRVDADAP
eukprot:144478-Rhodomonas_salina.4